MNEEIYDEADNAVIGEESEEMDNSLVNDGDNADTEINEELLDNKDSKTSPNGADNTIDKTKAYSKRLNEDRKLIEEQVRKDFEKQNDEFAKTQGFKSFKEMKEFAEEQKLRDLGIGDVDAVKNLIDEAVRNSPMVQEANKVIEEQKKAEGNKIIVAEIEKIHQVDPDINTFEDIVNMENREQFDDLVLNRGYSMSDAYKIVNYDKLVEKSSAKSKQEVLNNIGSKAHMKTISGNAGGDINVPTDILNQYRAYGFSDSEAAKYYKMHNK